ncbi:hypothetical protein QTN25_002512 [Entamoeba marina]
MSTQYDYNTLYIVGVTESASEVDVRDIFGKFGEIDKINMLLVRPPFKTRTVFIKYLNEEDARSALSALNNTDPFFSGSTLSVRFSEKNHSRKHSPQRPLPERRERDNYNMNYPKQTPPQFQNQPHYYQSGQYYQNFNPYSYQPSSYHDTQNPSPYHTQTYPSQQQQQTYSPYTPYSPYKDNNPYKAAQHNTNSPKQEQYTGGTSSNYNTDYPSSAYPYN